MNLKEMMKSIDPIKDWELHLKEIRLKDEDKDALLSNDPLHRARMAAAKAFSTPKNGHTGAALITNR
mgnify:FL=1|jgi:hypothetical protein